VTATEAAQAALVKQVPGAAYLQTIPGFGPVVIATLLGELGNLAAYAHPQQAVRMAGLNIVTASSGQYHGPSHLAKRGRPQARQVLYQAALVAVAHAGPVRDRFIELRTRLAPKAALMAIACKLLRVAWACLVHPVSFDAQRAFPATAAAPAA